MLVSPARVFILVRALTYATLFVGFLLVFLPARLLETSGLSRPAVLGPVQIAGVLLVVAGAGIATWCVLSFALLGRGTPAPFDPPRQLVVRGPYRFVRNPMYLGAGLALSGAALFFQSVAVFAYALLFLAVMHLFVVLYEEPTLRRTFGVDYQEYTARVRRWWPHMSSKPSPL